MATIVRKPGFRLEERNGKWVTISVSHGAENVYTARGRWDFVVLPNGQIRVIKPQEESSHTVLAGNGPVVYAGQVNFSQAGAIKSWHNGSGHFQPLASDAAQSGLPLDLFSDTSA